MSLNRASFVILLAGNVVSFLGLKLNILLVKLAECSFFSSLFLETKRGLRIAELRRRVFVRI